jgi:NAD(P) transhydrogenase
MTKDFDVIVIGGGLGLLAMMSNPGAELLNRTCFNYPTLGDLYKYATYEAILKQGR